MSNLIKRKNETSQNNINAVNGISSVIEFTILSSLISLNILDFNYKIRVVIYPVFNWQYITL